MTKAKSATSTPPAKLEIDWPAAYGRLEQIIAALRRGGWIDEKTASQALAHMRILVMAWDDYERSDELAEAMIPELSDRMVIDFLCRHNQSLDWVFFGDPRSMICQLAV